MKNGLLMGVGRHMVPVPSAVWRAHVSKSAEHGRDRLGFMSEEHHRVRDFVVLELPQVEEPLSPSYIAQRVGLPQERVQVILDELEKNMTFLYRGDGEAVTWAYPVTVDETPHHVIFPQTPEVAPQGLLPVEGLRSTGEEVYAA